MIHLTGDGVVMSDASPRQAYESAKPFAHCVVDDFAPEDELREVLKEWPAFEKMKYKRCRTSIKASCQDWTKFGPATTRVLKKLNSPEFLKSLEAVTGIEGLVADDALQGGGLHEIPPGGFLDMHVDFNWHEGLGKRKINLLLYLNEGWKWNGDLLLTDGKTVKSVAPAFNRCVIFNTTEDSWHGHPEPLTAPRSRKSIALYYYRKEERPSKVHNTIYAELVE